MTSPSTLEHRMIIAAKPAILDREAPIFGVCEAIGDDFGFNPNWLRAAMAPLIFWNPVYTLAGYFVVGALVLLSHQVFPDVREPAPAVRQKSPTEEFINDDQQAEPRSIAA
ncbi:PspC domain-containing protein [Sphingomonas sp.]|uniref:PspC domain-containing protein n=1 Tax=Sphingomonas sp. TaxID=28214 RepID=UPI00325FAD4F